MKYYKTETNSFISEYDYNYLSDSLKAKCVLIEQPPSQDKDSESDAVEWDEFHEWLNAHCGHRLNKSIKNLIRINWNAPTKNRKK